MLDRFEEYTNIPQGMQTFLQRHILITDTPRENDDKFTQFQSFLEEDGAKHQDLKVPMCGCGCGRNPLN